MDAKPEGACAKVTLDTVKFVIVRLVYEDGYVMSAYSVVGVFASYDDTFKYFELVVGA
jgi:hypothetical protein